MGLFRFFFIGNGGSNAKNSDPQPQPLHVSKHSDAFNNSMTNLLNAYFKMTEAFVNWDTVSINNSGNELKVALDSLKLDELKKDSDIYLTALDPCNNAKAELLSILTDPSIAEKRGSLNIFSDNLRLLLTTVKYDRAILFWQECPMAFGEDKPGNWISKTEEVRNPYLGTKDPKYGNKMLNCGAPKYTIKPDPSADSTKSQ
jgi:hypothetical protein